MVKAIYKNGVLSRSPNLYLLIYPLIHMPPDHPNRRPRPSFTNPLHWIAIALRRLVTKNRDGPQSVGGAFADIRPINNQSTTIMGILTMNKTKTAAGNQRPPSVGAPSSLIAPQRHPLRTRNVDIS
jgi:hypothetical protein